MKASPTSTLPTPEQIQSLAPRHFDVWAAVALGYTSEQMGKLFDISPKTVGNHRDELYRRLGLHDTCTLTRAAIAYGIITVPLPGEDSVTPKKNGNGKGATKERAVEVKLQPSDDQSITVSLPVSP